MASSSITSWQIDGETMERQTDFILGGSKITADGDGSYEIKTHLLLGRKAMTNLDSILKSKDITLPTKVPLVKTMVFLTLQPHGLQPTRLVHPWDFPGKSSGVGCHCLLRISS